MLLSICIPTYNRSKQLDNCLNSILIASKKVNKFDFEVCISDNNSEYNLSKILDKYKDNFRINFNKNSENLGFAINGIKTVKMASGEYSWMIGDDDLILPETFVKLEKIFKNNLDKDYFFVNSYHLDSSYINNFTTPFDTNYLNVDKLKAISKIKKNKEGYFWDVINPEVSWDFLIGIYLNIFKTKKWLNSLDIINRKNIEDKRVWSNFDNTCLHPVVISKAFKDSKIYICADPLSVNLVGVREWQTMYEFVEIVRIPELLDFYRSQGLSFIKYAYCKNFALRNFSNYIFKILIGGEKMGRSYINFKKHIFNNLAYPNVYLSLIYFIFRKLSKIFKTSKS